jgi:hypothetical protein
MSTKATTYDSNRDSAEPEPLKTADEVLDAIEVGFIRRPGDRVMLREFPVETSGRSRFRIDGLLVEMARSHKPKLVAYEVKVDRGDFQRELIHPEKRERAMALAEEFYFAVPAGLIARDEVPDDCGLLWLQPGGAAPCIMKLAPRREPPELDWLFVRHLMRNVYKAGRMHSAQENSLKFWPQVRDVLDALTMEDVGAGELDILFEALEDELRVHERREEAGHVADARRQILG